MSREPVHACRIMETSFGGVKPSLRPRGFEYLGEVVIIGLRIWWKEMFRAPEINERIEMAMVSHRTKCHWIWYCICFHASLSIEKKNRFRLILSTINPWSSHANWNQALVFRSWSWVSSSKREKKKKQTRRIVLNEIQWIYSSRIYRPIYMRTLISFINRASYK